MTQKRRDDESESVDAEIANLEAEREAFIVQQEAVIIKLRQLREAEDKKTGTYFAKEIFQLSQDKLCLASEIDIRRRKINRLKMPDDMHGMLH